MGATQPGKVPAATLTFWIIKILATTLGETGGDVVSMSLELGYFLGTVIFASLFFAAVTVQLRAKTFHAPIYWVTIIATTTVGTTLADLVDRSLGVGYPGGVAILVLLLSVSLFTWKSVFGTIAFDAVSTSGVERIYWITILLSQTLGTALGDWAADSLGFGYAGSAFIFGLLLILVAVGYFLSTISRTSLFWAAFILTRPLGAVVGDWLDKPLDHGGLALSRLGASLVLCAIIALLIHVFPQKAALRSH